MEILFLLVPLSVVLVGIAIGVFVWAVRDGQFDDLDSPAWRILVDDRQDKTAGKASGDKQEDGKEHPSRQNGDDNVNHS